MKPFKHQEETTEFLRQREAAFITSSPGTGKTRSVIDCIKEREGRTLVLAPKSILEPSWADDIKKFAPEMTYAIATASNRREAFEMGTKVVITNIDAATWIVKNPSVLQGFETLVLDESTAFKSPTSQRSKAVEKIASGFKYRIAMTGTPTPLGIIDIFQQIKIIDRGQRLGTSFWKFRAATHTPIPRGAFTNWVEKEGINDAIYGMIQDINIRYKLEECISMPENFVTDIQFDMSAEHKRLYHEMEADMIVLLKETAVTAVNQAVLAGKLLQMASGAMYDNNGTMRLLNSERYELIMDLIEARDQCVVAFQWGHQKEELIKLAEKRKIEYGVIDGTVPANARTDVVNRFQKGGLKVIFAHPASASHGLTLTAGTTTIWSSPTYNTEHYEQFNNRIYRAGQTKRTETILISARGTIDTKVYDKLNHKRAKMNDLLELLGS